MVRIDQTFTNDEVQAVFPELMRTQRMIEKKLMNPELEDRDDSAAAHAALSKVLRPFTDHIQRLRDLAARRQ